MPSGSTDCPSHKLRFLPDGLAKAEICEHLEVTEAQLENVLQALAVRTPISLDSPCANHNDSRMIILETVPDDRQEEQFDQIAWEMVTDSIERAEELDLNGDVTLAIRNLAYRESFKDLAEQHGISHTLMGARTLNGLQGGGGDIDPPLLNGRNAESALPLGRSA